MPEVMSFNDETQGWNMMAKLINRFPHSERVQKHIKDVNKDKNVLGTK